MKYQNRNKEARSYRVKSAKERQEAYNKLSPGEKLALLDQTLGLNAGATKQRAKLNAAIKATAKA